MLTPPPSSQESFTVQGWHIAQDRQTLSFNFESSKYGTFTETLKFPAKLPPRKVNSPEFDRLAQLLSSALAVSYYKLHAPLNLALNMPRYENSRAASGLIRAVYTEGLGEFYARNALPYPPKLNISIQGTLRDGGEEQRRNDEPEAPPPLTAAGTRALVAFGGGKDSHVSLEILRRLGYETEAISVVLSDKTKARMGRMYGAELTYIERRIDKKLLRLNNEDGTMNGHVPITAMNSLILSLYAFCHDIKAVVFSNERGSSQFTRMYNGHPVNHQYSKGRAFEALLSNAISQASAGAVYYFSLLRPFSEAWIGRAYANLCTSSWDKVASCNKNFIFHGAGLKMDERWCGACSKCLYTAIIMAPFLDHEAFLDIFEHDFFGDISNLPVIESLAGLGGEKPWECVGDINDTRALLHLLAYHEIWSNKACIKEVKLKIEALQTLAQSKAHIKAELGSHGAHIIPAHIYAQILKLETSWRAVTF